VFAKGKHSSPKRWRRDIDLLALNWRNLKKGLTLGLDDYFLISLGLTVWPLPFPFTIF
jgi:hypothetical protein